LLVGALSCAKTIDDRGSSQVDFTNPKRVLSSVFYAAQTGQAGHLSSLCDTKEGDADVARICSQVPGGEDWDAFVRQFAKGRLIGEARISGDRAFVNFVFGPQGTDEETMELVRRGNHWYLLAF
jgi:hypothetical protein